MEQLSLHWLETLWEEQVERIEQLALKVKLEERTACLEMMVQVSREPPVWVVLQGFEKVAQEQMAVMGMG